MGPCTGSQNGHTTAVKILLFLTQGSDFNIIMFSELLYMDQELHVHVCYSGLHNTGTCACVWRFIMSF